MTDMVIHWNDVLLEVFRKVGGAPGPLARGAAMMHAAVYDAVGSVVPTHEPYLVRVPTNPTASVEAAIAHAAATALLAAFPRSPVDVVAELGKALSLLPPGTTAAQIAAGKAVGLAAARAVVQDRDDDGAEDSTAYRPVVLTGSWRPTDDKPAATPNWSRVKPFCLASGSQFRPARPGGFRSISELLCSTEYASQLDEVQRLGSATSMERTAEQTEIALFWANDLDGTSKPPGQLFTITKVISQLRGLDVVENARLFALVAMAMADAGITAWDAKYATDLDLWRPETAIHEADSSLNPETTPDPTWRPLSHTEDGTAFSPAFPAYVSGHATFGAAHAAVMRRFFGTDNVTFTATSEDPALPGGVTRTFHSFTHAALENARSRVYLGVHFQWDGDHGFLSGSAVGEHVFDTRLRPLTA